MSDVRRPEMKPSFLTCFDATTFSLANRLYSCRKFWEIPLSKNAKSPHPVDVSHSKSSLLILANNNNNNNNNSNNNNNNNNNNNDKTVKF